MIGPVSTEVLCYHWNTMSGLFLSDLHLFSRRSIGQRHWDQHQDLISAAKSIVLGGDMFDLRWSQMGDLDATLRAADDWLENAISLNPDAGWSYLLGNHDCHPQLQAMLQNVSQRHANFSWNPTHLRIGQNVFLHGDVLDARSRSGGIDQYRARFHEHKPRKKVGNLLYSAAVEARLHIAIPRIRHTPKQTCSRLIAYLESCEDNLLTDVHNIYFGHTHIAMSGYQFDRFRFYNAGSGIRHSQFTPAVFDAT